MSKHTLGPRKVSTLTFHVDEELKMPAGLYYTTLARTYKADHGSERWESVGEFFTNEADAQLNAAAPDLLEALKAITRSPLFGDFNGIFRSDVFDIIAKAEGAK